MKNSQEIMAFKRTLFASERTLMAWVRTAVSLIGFGFSIPSFFSLLKESAFVEGTTFVNPNTIGIFLTALGSFGLLGGMWSHIHLIRGFSETKAKREFLSPSMFVSFAVAMLGFWTLAALIF